MLLETLTLHTCVKNAEQRTPGMIAEVISIGDELTSGQRLDTNTQWLSQQLGELGIPVRFHTTVGDDLDANVHVFRAAVERADIVVATGGLGPTADDLTRDAIAAAMEKELLLNPAVLEHIRGLFARRHREMPERNVVQAMFPAGSHVIPNPHGSAPGIDIEYPRTSKPPSRLFALPGVPAEMKEMWRESVAPVLENAGAETRRVICHHRIKCFGVGESDLEAMLPDLIRRGRQPQVGITVSQATITLRITAEGDSPAACQAQIQPTVAEIKNCLGSLVFGKEDDELQHAVLELLRQRSATLATCEWGTGGLISNWVNEAPASEGVYLGGTVVRNRSALAHYGIERDSERSASSKEMPVLVAAMARNCRDMFSSDWSLAVGPFPAGDSEHNSAGTLHLAIAGPSGVLAEKARFGGHPDILRARSGKQALNFLRLTLLQV